MAHRVERDGVNGLASQLSKYQPRSSPMTDGERRAMAARCWHDFGIVCILPAEITNDFDRQAVINAAVKLFGERACDDGAN